MGAENMRQFFIGSLVCLSFAFGCARENPSEAVTSSNVGIDLTNLAALVAEENQLFESAIAQAKTTRGKGSPLMWTYGDEDTTVYLLGSFHLLPTELDWRTAPMLAAFEASDTLVLESDILTEAGISAQLQAISRYGMYGDGGSLSATLGDELAARADEVLTESFNISLSLVDKMQPWFAGFSIAEFMTAELNLDPNAGVDRYFGTRRGDRIFLPLESADDVFSIISSMPVDHQIQEFIVALETLDNSVPAIQILMEEWADGDEAGLEALLIGLMEPDSPTYQALLVERNNNWMPKLVGLLDAPGHKFVIVGAAHMMGDDSVIALLEAENIAVSPF